jgi:HSP20 family protein
MIKSSHVPGVNSAGGDMTIQPNDDAAWLSLFRQHLDEICSYMFRMRDQGCGQREFSPAIDIYESSNQFVIEVDLPGFSENDFTISVISNTVRIEGVKRQDKNDAAISYICLERHFGRFHRSVEIPAAFDPGALQKSFERGVLTIMIKGKMVSG